MRLKNFSIIFYLFWVMGPEKIPKSLEIPDNYSLSDNPNF